MDADPEWEANAVVLVHREKSRTEKQCVDTVLAVVFVDFSERVKDTRTHSTFRASDEKRPAWLKEMLSTNTVEC